MDSVKATSQRDTTRDTRDIQAADYWKYADRLAAVRRLELARRYQDKHNRLDAEFNNLRTSQSWLATQTSQETAHLLIDYTEVLASYLEERGLRRQLVRWCDDGVRACHLLQHNPGQLLLHRSRAEFGLGQWNNAMVSTQEAIKASEGKEASIYAKAILTLGILQFNQGDPLTLKTLSQAEMLLSQQLDYPEWAEAVHLTVAYYNQWREFDKALALCPKVEQIYQLAGVANPSDRTLLMRGAIHRKRGDYQQATTCLQRLLKVTEAQGNKAGVTLALHHLAWVHLEQAHNVEARRFSVQALTLYEEIGDMRGLADALDQLGVIELADGNQEEALSHLQRSLAIRRQFSHPYGEANTQRHLAIAYFRMAALFSAVYHLWQSVVIYWRLKAFSAKRIVLVLRGLFDRMLRRRRWTK